ncbi:MAG: hypothetical protein JSV62_09900 [Promethearchaeota archaeon]|nr:MAG: hypothetical protein JSV62_09900 [Candidatus Lokiarchaeota archaeon]
MIREDSQIKRCTDCGKSITFSEFCLYNSSISKERAKDLWNDSMIVIYCPECYFNIPEKPFKQKRGYFNYHLRFTNN